jgi:hypothetical protein
LAIGCGVNVASEAHDVYLIDLQNSKTLKIVEGNDLKEPSLWVNPSMYLPTDTLCLDSLGNYNSSSTQPFFAARMLAFWQKCKQMRIVFAGSSQTAQAVDPTMFTVSGVYNMAIPGGDFPVETAMITGYLLNHCDSLKLIGMDLIPPLLFKTDIAFVPEWDDAIISSKGYAYDMNHQFWSQGAPLNFSNFMLQIPIPTIPDLDTLGVYRNSCEGWGGPTPEYWHHSDSTTDNPVYRTNIELIKSFARNLAQRGIHFLLYLTPVSPFYKDYGVFESGGPTLQTAAMICKDLMAMQDSVPGYFHFCDANKMGEHDYADS